MLAGLACYALLSELHVAAAVSVVAGFLFALMVRVASISLLREMMLHERVPHQR